MGSRRGIESLSRPSIGVATTSCLLAVIWAFFHAAPPVHTSSESDSNLEIATAMLQVQVTLNAEKTSIHKDASEVKRRTAWQTPKNDPTDWLFHVRTTYCDAKVPFDIETNSFTVRVIALVLLACCLLLLTLSPGETSPLPSRQNPERIYFLDYARSVAVMCVVYEHSGGAGYTSRNTIFALWWCLPFLYMTSGTSFMMSHSSLASYLTRLLRLLAIGVSFNLAADAYSRRDWHNDFGTTIYQMWFVAMLIVMAIVSAPLSSALKVIRDTTEIPFVTPAVCFWSCLTLAGLIGTTVEIDFNGMEKNSHWVRTWQGTFEHVPWMVFTVSGTFLLCFWAIAHTGSTQNGMLVWAILLFLYVPPCIAPYHQGSQIARLVGLYVLAMVSQVWPGQGMEAISKAVASYWPILFFILGAISMPDMTGRCDQFPPGTVWERLRHLSGEAVLTICYLSGGFQASDCYNICESLRYWSLFAYATHVAWYRTMGSPWSTLFTFGTMPIFYAWRYRAQQMAQKHLDVSTTRVF